MKKKAIVDRIVDKKMATLLVGDEEKEYVLPLTQLPRGIEEGLCLHVAIENNVVHVIEIDYAETKRRQKSATDLMAKLKGRKGSQFKKD